LEKEVIIDLFFIFAILQNLTSIEKKFYWSCEFQQLKQDVWVYKKEVINITVCGLAKAGIRSTNVQYTTNVDSSTNVQFTTSALLLPNRC